MTKKNTKATYLTYRDSDGCDDLLVIYNAKTGEDILSISFWASEKDWAERVEAKVKLLIANPKLLLSLRGASENKIDEAIQQFQASAGE